MSAAAPPQGGSTHLKIIVGVTDDTAKWMLRQDGVVGVHRDLRLMAVRVTIPWRPWQVQPTKRQKVYLHRIARMIVLRDRIVLSVYNRAAYAPIRSRSRTNYCTYLRNVVRRLPLIHDVQIWNEANNPTFWPEAAGPEPYEALLAKCWDVLHALRGPVNVISSTAPRHDPAAFILGVGDAYRASGRQLPIADTIGHNPYPQHSSEPPSATHEGTDVIGEGDYETLMDVLEKAFAETGQPVPGRGGVTIWYLETGFQTVPPPEKRRFYRGRENDPAPLPAVAAPREGGERSLDQATQLRDAVLLAYCQPAVSGIFNFELLDEDKLGGWQSGLLWRDGTRKPSYDAFKDVIAEVRRRDTDCSKVPGAQPPG